MKVISSLTNHRTYINKWINCLDLLVIILILALFCIYSYTTPKIENFGSDTSIYFGLAKSLLDDHRYWFNFEPHTIYPPGFPLLLACIIFLMGESFGALIKAMTMISFLGLVGTYFLIKMLSGSKVALLVILLTVTSYAFYYFSTAGIISDIPYFTATIYALLFFELGNRTDTRWATVLSYILVTFLTIYIVQIRSVGIAFVIGLLLWMINPLQIILKRSKESLFERIKKWCPVVLLSIGVFFLWMNWCSQNRIQTYSDDYMSSYSQQFLKEDPHQINSPKITLKKVPSRLLNMLIIRTANAGRMLFNLPWINPTWHNPLVSLLFIMLLIGLSASLIQGGKLLDWYVLSYIGILLLWPFDEGQRFLLPIQPFLYLYVIICLKLLYDLVKSKELKRYYPLCGIFVGVMLIYTIVHISLNERISKQDIMSLGGWFLLCGCLVLMYFWKSAKTLALEDNEGSLLISSSKREYVSVSLVIVLFVMLITAGGFKIFSQARQNLHPQPRLFRHYPTVQASKWIIDNTQTNDVIMADNYAILHRLTKRKTFRFPLTTQTSVLRDTIIRDNVNYLIVLNEREYEYYKPSTMNRFANVKKAYPNMVRLVHNFENGKIYKVE